MTLLMHRDGKWSLRTAIALWCILVTIIAIIPPDKVISWDTLGYYLYLPATFIYKDPLLLHQAWLHHALEMYGGLDGGGFYQAHQVASGNWVMKYPMGLAVLWAPFVAVAHWIAPVLGYPADGFSRPYQLSIVVAEMTYALLGLLWLRAVLLRWWEDRVVSATLVLVVLGTTYLHQALFSNGMPHIFLFTLQAGTLYATIRWHETKQARYAVLLALTIGLATLSRPTELVLLLIPLLWHGPEQARKWRMLAGVVLGIGLIGSAQLIYWKYAAGEFLHMSYVGHEEGFDFLMPHIGQVLFSFRKGWFIYTPLMLFGVFGLFKLPRWAPEVRLAIPVFLAINLYLVASWSTWWYAESFGNRALMQSIAVMAVPLAATVRLAGEWTPLYRRGLFFLMGILVALNIFQSWQALTGLIPGSRMTFSYYVAIFGRTQKILGGDQRLLVDRSAPIPPFVQEDTRHHLVKRLWISGDQVLDTQPDTAQRRYTATDSYSPAVRFAFKDLTNQNNLWVRISGKAHCSPDATGAIVVTMEHGTELYGYQQLAFEAPSSGGSSDRRLDKVYLTPETRNRGDSLAIYYWHRGGITDVGPIELEFYEPVVPAPFGTLGGDVQ